MLLLSTYSLRSQRKKENLCGHLCRLFLPIPETRTFYYIGTDSFAACLYHFIVHKESIDKDFKLKYHINLPYYLRMTVELFLFAKIQDEVLAYKVLFLMNDCIRYGNK